MARNDVIALRLSKSQFIKFNEVAEKDSRVPANMAYVIIKEFMESHGYDFSPDEDDDKSLSAAKAKRE
ncbi:MAG: hypothetical protein ACXWAT_00515 [Methylobacter sp.]